MSGIPSFHRLLWGWDAPVLDKCVDFLTRDWQPDSRTLDLSDTLIIVPTSEAGRRLKEALAHETGRQGGGGSIPWVWAPEQALLPPLPGHSRKAASRLQAHIAWQQALMAVAAGDLEALFPSLPEERAWTWHVEMARLLAELNSLLGAGGRTFAEAADCLSQDSARWRDLAILERAYHAELAKAGFQDMQVLKRENAAQPRLPEGLRRIVILAAPDLPPLFGHWIESCRGMGLEVIICIHAPQSLAAAFDAIGRPLPAFWGEDADQTLPLTNDAIHLHHDAAAQSGSVIGLLRLLTPRGHTAVGACDPEVSAVLEEKLALEQVRLFEPGGIPVQEVGLWHVLSNIRTLMAGGSWKAFGILLRIPEVRQALTGSKEHGLAVLEAADDLAADHLPVTLAHARELLTQMAAMRQERHPERPHGMEAMRLLETALAEAEALIEDMRRLPLPQAAQRLLIRIYGERPFDPANPVDQLTTDLGSQWLRFANEVETETQRFGLKPRPEDAFDLSLEALAQIQLSEPRGDVDLILQGWLELLWERAPHLIVAGLNEEFVPGITIAHPFLPDGVRKELGLPSQVTRFARDAYTLRALAEQRLLQGKLEIICGQWSERGNALRPSRILFLCPDAELPQRVAHLFPKDDHGAGEAEPPRTIAWKLRPRAITPKVATISPSRIRSYLECPFRDYLTHELRMEPADPRKRELAPNEFGSLAHHAFQKLGEDPRMRLSTDAKEIEAFLVEAAFTQLQKLYGARTAPLVSLQFEGLRQRLKHAAEFEAGERQKGWRILKSEWTLGGEEDQNPLIIEGARLRCTIDRVEHNEATGQLRVLDFKTADKAKAPMGEHAAKVGTRKVIAPEDEWKCFSHSSGIRLQWKDLQLPLYAAALRLHGQTPNEVGYFAMPKSVQETQILPWPDFNDEWIDGALECAAEVVRRLRSGIFWPPAPKAYDRPFDELFLGDIAATVEMPDLPQPPPEPAG